MQLTPALVAILKPNLSALAAALTAAGHTHRGLSLDGSNLLTNDTEGNPIDLSLAAQAFVNAWIAPTPPTPPNWGPDLLTDDEVQAQAAAIVDGLRAYRALASPTLAQTTQAVKAIAQVAIYLTHQRFPNL
jgi:hypothetical protein